MDIENVKKMFNIVGLTPPMRLQNGDLLSFFMYLFRCQPIKDEQVNYDVVSLKPYGNYIYKHLSTNLKDRTIECRDWFNLMQPGFYLHVPIGPTKGGPEAEDEFRQLFVDMDESEVVVFTKMVVESINKKFLPSFSPIALVWHVSQIDEQTGKLLPVHGHALFRATIEPSERELGIISEEKH